MNQAPVIKKKAYYSISEVSRMTGLEQHVIRYWEQEFPKLKPKKNRAGNRQFRDKDITTIKYIKHLLHNEQYTIAGARKKLQDAGYKEVEGQVDLLSSLMPPAPVYTSIPQVTPHYPEAPQAPSNDFFPEQSSDVTQAAALQNQVEQPSKESEEWNKIIVQLKNRSDLLNQVRSDLKSIKSLLRP